MTAFTESRRPGEAILREEKGYMSRSELLVAPEVAIAMNSLLARVVLPDGVPATTTTDAGNTGDGEVTVAIPAVSTKARIGVYRIFCIEAAEGGGRFMIEDPHGVEVGTVAVGAVFDGDIKFWISLGDTDFAVGDGFSLRVAIVGDALVHVPFDPDGTDGSEVPVAYAINSVASDVGVKRVWAISRIARLSSSMIAWPDEITDEQKAAAIKALARREIFVD